MSEINRDSILSAGVPHRRGTPTHIEHDDNTAFTSIQNGQVLEMHTPQDIFPRVHEYLHARHSDDRVMRRAYRNVNFFVRQLTEDCVIHIRHWPWGFDRTPSLIRKSTVDFMAKEKRAVVKHLADKPEDKGAFADFAVRLRQASINFALDGRFGWKTLGFASEAQKNLAGDILALIRKGYTRKAAEMIHRAFFDPVEKEPEKPGETERPDGDEEGDLPGHEEIDDDDRGGLPANPPMEIIELPHTIRTKEAKAGKRRARTGPRLYRPALRKPILPQRLFVKRMPIEPAGAILIDASGSMGGWDIVSQWVEKAPYATVAYYAGHGNEGQLFVYARGGRHAAEMTEPDGGDNTVDGPAMDWLLSQRGPRVMITDREFCGARDSQAQVVRLERLERTGQIKVLNYRE